MRLHCIALVVLAACGGLSCKPDGGGASGTATALAKADDGAGASADGAKQQTKGDEAWGPVIPKDAQFTIYCTTISGPDHGARAKALKAQLTQVTRMGEWYIVQGDGQSTLYYGFYRDEKDARGQEDRRKIAGLQGSDGEKLFHLVCLMPLEGGDAGGPPQWNLANAKGMYTLQIALYRDSPQRKEYAVEAVRGARAGGYEAYYHHGPNASVVCIGAWPETAVSEATEVRAENPNEVVGVLPPSLPVTEGLTTPDGRRIRMVKPTFEVLDPALLAAMRQFPAMSINGLGARRVKNPQTGQVRTVTDPSIVVRIPRKDGSVRAPALAQQQRDVVVADPNAAAKTALPPATAVRPPTKEPQGGKLRSIED